MKFINSNFANKLRESLFFANQGCIYVSQGAYAVHIVGIFLRSAFCRSCSDVGKTTYARYKPMLINDLDKATFKDNGQYYYLAVYPGFHEGVTWCC